MRSLLRVGSCLALVLAAFSLAATGAEPAAADKISEDLLVRRALEADLAGNKTLRVSLLERATSLAPDYAPARWHSGYVRSAEGWLTISESQRRAAEDSQLAEYRRLLETSGNSLVDQIALARWCRRHQMKEHEQFHWRSVLALQPTNDDALAALKLKKWRGMWLTLEEIEHCKRLVADAEAAFDKWSDWLADVQTDLASDEARQEAEAMGRLKTLDDLAALPALAAALQKGDEHFCLAAIDTLAAMPEQQATDLLVWQAVSSRHAKVRQAAAEALQPRPLHSYVPVLVGSLTSPLEFSRYMASNGAGNLTSGFVIERETPFAELAWSTNRTSDIERLPNRAGRMRSYNAFLASVNRQSRIAAQMQIKAARQVAVANRITEAQNARIFAVLDTATGQKIEHAPQAWWRWWQEHNELDIPDEKPRYLENRSSQYTEVHLPPPTMSCFIAGTPVWTETGLQPIEKLRRGDRVLSQDPQTGELAFKFVVATTLRPVSPTFRVQVGTESLVATRGHPFWVAGQGWRMAKQLQPSDRLYGAQGITPIAELSEGPDVEAHNLVIDDFGTYFVGQTGLLVRDNTLGDLPTTELPGLEVVSASSP
jgi:hypothetical protein